MYLIDLRVLHASAPNASRVPRLILTQRFLLLNVRDDIRCLNKSSAQAEPCV